jgi:hypothetical protein
MSVTVDGINYSLSGSNATVTGATNRAITTLTIPSTITYLGTTYNVTKIGNNAFKDYLNLTSITIPNSVTSIEYEAFKNCTSLTSIFIPSGVTSIGSKVFRYCSNLLSIVVDSANTAYSSLNNVIFNKAQTTLILYHSGLSSTSYTIPSSVTSIGGGAFSYSDKLTSVTIPNGLLTIGGSAFFGCKLTSIFIPASVTSIGGDNYTFFGCPLTSIVVDSANTAYSSLDNVLFNKAQTTLIQYASGLSSTSYTVPSSVLTIADNAFTNCFSLASVTFMGDIPTIGTNNFTENTSDTAYYYIGAQNINRLSPTPAIFTNIVGLAGAQPAPVISSVTPSDQNATINFTQSTTGGLNPITSYCYSIDGGLNWVSTQTITSPITVTGLTNGTPYNFVLRNFNGFNSAISNIVRVPSAPTINSVTASNGQAIIAFTAGAENGSAITGYQLSINSGSNWFSVGTTTPIIVTGTSSSITAAGLTNGTRYTFLVRAVNAIGAGASVSSVSTLVDVAPGAPTINSVTASNGQATVAFTAGTNIGSAITGYEYSKDNGLNWVPVGTSSPITVTTGLTNGTEYTFLVRAVNDIGGGATVSTVPTLIRPTLPEAKVLNTLKYTYALFYGYQLQELVASGLYTLPELTQIGYVLGELKAHFTTETLITSWLFTGSELKQEGLIQSGIDFFIIVIVFEGVFSVRRTYALNNTNEEITRYNVFFNGQYLPTELSRKSM